MSGCVIVLGAAGRVGRAAAEAFRDAGWDVRSLVRGASAERAAPGTEIVEIDARDTESVIEAAAGADVVLHALNPRFVDWARDATPYAETAIAAARAAGATLMLPGNVYNYGTGMPKVLDETTPMHPTSRKGALRVAIEEHMRAAAGEGLRTIVVRAGDVYGGGSLGSWFDRVITRYIALQGRMTYPGPLDVVHEWAYLPDYAAALVKLAAARAKFSAFETFGFAGHAVTGRQFLGPIQRATGRNLTVAGMPWTFLRLMSPFVSTFRELTEISYLWRVPHRIDGTKLRAAIGEIPHTPIDEAIKQALIELHLVRSPDDEGE